VIADDIAATREDRRILAAEPEDVAERIRRQVAGWQLRQAKERVAGRVGQIPGWCNVGALLYVHLPRPAGRGVIPLRVMLGA
jgi:hypothetical protein